MKKLTVSLIVFGFAVIPTLLLAQPPRPYPGQPYAQPQMVKPAPVAHPAALPTMQVHTPPRPMPGYMQQHIAQRPPVVIAAPHQPAYYPHAHAPMMPPRVVTPHVVTPTIVAPHVVAPAVVAPQVVAPYYPPTSGFSLTIGGKNGIFSISTAR